MNKPTKLSSYKTSMLDENDKMENINSGNEKIRFPQCRNIHTD